MGVYAEELAVVLDEVGSERAAIMGDRRWPDRDLLRRHQTGTHQRPHPGHTSAKYVAANDYPIGIPAEVAEALLAQVDQQWGTEPWRR